MKPAAKVKEDPPGGAKNGSGNTTESKDEDENGERNASKRSRDQPSADEDSIPIKKSPHPSRPSDAGDQHLLGSMTCEVAATSLEAAAREEDDGPNFQTRSQRVDSDRRGEHSSLDTGARLMDFPVKLMSLLQQRVAPDAMWFVPEGTAVAIDKDKFVKKILNDHFQSLKYSSAVRMFNRWGFRRISHPALRGSHEIAFHHLLFRQDSPHLTELIKKDCDPLEVAIQFELIGGSALIPSAVPVGASGQGETLINSSSLSTQRAADQQYTQQSQSTYVQHQQGFAPLQQQGQQGGAVMSNYSPLWISQQQQPQAGNVSFPYHVVNAPWMGANAGISPQMNMQITSFQVGNPHGQNERMQGMGFAGSQAMLPGPRQQQQQQPSISGSSARFLHASGYQEGMLSRRMDDADLEQPDEKDGNVN